MREDNKAILQKANAASSNGDYDAFLSYCTEDTEWNYVGEQTLRGKEEVKKYMQATYKDAPQFQEKRLIAEDDHVVALGTITLSDENGKPAVYSYCDVWQFRDGKIASLTAFVIKSKGKI